MGGLGQEYVSIELAKDDKALRQRWRKHARKRGFIYFIGPTSLLTPKIKIGFTTGKVGNRLRALQTGSPLKLDVIGYFDGSQVWELMFHQFYVEHHSHGEWFNVRGDLKSAIDIMISCSGEDGRLSYEDACRAIFEPIESEGFPRWLRKEKLTILKIAKGALHG